jgi:hypothetical protein
MSVMGSESSTTGEFKMKEVFLQTIIEMFFSLSLVTAIMAFVFQLEIGSDVRSLRRRIKKAEARLGHDHRIDHYAAMNLEGAKMYLELATEMRKPRFLPPRSEASMHVVRSTCCIEDGEGWLRQLNLDKLV